MMLPGQPVTLNVPENPFLHGRPATIVSLEEWGAHVETPAAATGRFRALYCEMEANPPQEGMTGDVCDRCGSPNMQRSGTCLVCRDCGETTGC